jgi:hypothetical protein
MPGCSWIFLTSYKLSNKNIREYNVLRTLTCIFLSAFRTVGKAKRSEEKYSHYASVSWIGKGGVETIETTPKSVACLFFFLVQFSTRMCSQIPVNKKRLELFLHRRVPIYLQYHSYNEGEFPRRAILQMHGRDINSLFRRQSTKDFRPEIKVLD